MKLELNEEILHTRYDGEHVTFGVFIAPQGDLDDDDNDNALREALVKWADGEKVSVLFRFSVRTCISNLIDYNQFQQAPTELVMMDEDDKPMVESMRAELLELVAKLDEIKFMPLAEFEAVAGASIAKQQ